MRTGDPRSGRQSFAPAVRPASSAGPPSSRRCTPSSSARGPERVSSRWSPASRESARRGSHASSRHTASSAARSFSADRRTKTGRRPTGRGRRHSRRTSRSGTTSFPRTRLSWRPSCQRFASATPRAQLHRHSVRGKSSFVSTTRWPALSARADGRSSSSSTISTGLIEPRSTCCWASRAAPPQCWWWRRCGPRSGRRHSSSAWWS
jgi:hypothetical protein